MLLSLGAADGFTCDGGKNQKEYGEIYQPMSRVHPPCRVLCSRAPGKLDYFDNQITVKIIHHTNIFTMCRKTEYSVITSKVLKKCLPID